MSKKVKIEKQTLVPKLRFPEFRDAAEWDEKTLNEIGQTINGLSGKSADDFGVGCPFVTYKQVFDSSWIDLSKCGRVRIKAGEKQNSLQRGDVLFTTSSETPNEVGFASVLIESTPEDTYLNSFCFSFRPDSLRQLKPEFSRYLFHSPVYRRWVSALGQGSTRFNLSKKAFLALSLPVPDEEEQQKIADCLSSLDALIAAQAEKIEALKTHKKGLMQQLFPRKGEIVPRLRFPEFREVGEWKEMQISKALLEQPRPIDMDNEGEYSLVTVKRRYGGVVSRGVFRGKSIKVKTQFLLQENDFLISKRQIVHRACGVVPKALDGSIVSNEYSVLRTRDGFDVSFFDYFAQQPTVSQSFLRCSVGIVIEKMLFKLNDWLKEEFLFPSLQEQRKIADCLSSLDALIAAQSEKLGALKDHKKGLMQRLFPRAQME